VDRRPERVTVKLTDRREFEARVPARTPGATVAVLKIEAATCRS